MPYKASEKAERALGCWDPRNSIHENADNAGITYEEAWSILRYYGLKYRPDRSPKKDKILKCYTEGKTAREVEKEVGCTVTYVRMVLKKYGLPLKKPIRHSQETARRLRLWDQTKTIKDNASLLGIPYYKANSLAHSHNLQFKRTRRKGIPCKKIIYPLYKPGIKVSTLVEQSGLSRQQVLEVMHRYGLDLDRS